MKATLLLLGANGQLGRTFCQHWQTEELARNFSLSSLTSKELDLTNTEAISQCLDNLSPDLVVNAAAYTAVDLAESERERAFDINEKAVAEIALWCAENECRILHVSTDFVFDGEAKSPYSPNDRTSPLGNYGASKLAGEKRLQETLPSDSAIVRTSWLYSEYGNNFVKTMLRLMEERDELRVVGDQIGSPTSTHSLVQFIFRWIESGCTAGLFHWNDGASISWFDFAVEIQRSALEKGMLDSEIPIRSIITEEYPTPAKRPAYSVMDRSDAVSFFSAEPQTWQTELEQVLTSIASN